LLTLLQQQRLLLVLDGFERELRLYAHLNAAYQSDEVDEKLSPNARDCVDPYAAAFLQAIASVPIPSRVLLTSRLLPREVEGLAGCRAEALLALAPEDAVTFFQSQGIKGTRAEIEEACRPYGYHPLALRLLAGVIVRDQRLPRDIKAAQRHPVLQDLKGKAQHHVLEVAYEALAPKPRDLLSRLAAFRSPTSYDTLSVINPFKTTVRTLRKQSKRVKKNTIIPAQKRPDGKKLESEEQLEHALDELRERGLLFFDAEAGRYDLHPVVRQYSYDRLADKAGVHTQLRDYFSTVPGPEKDKIQSLEDLTPVIELYHHTVRAGKFDEAINLFIDRLHDALYYRFGAYQLIIELMRVLFPEGEDKPPRLKNESAQAWTLNGLANSYSLSGQPRRAVPLFEMHNALREKAENKSDLASGLGNLADDQLKIGALAAAEHNLRRSIDLCREINDERGEAIGHRHLGRVLAYFGKFDEANNEFFLAEEIEKENMHELGMIWERRAITFALMGEVKKMILYAQKAYDSQSRNKFPWCVVHTDWLVGSAKLVNLELPEAEKYLTEALTRCRRINLVEMEPDILLAWSEWQKAKGEKEEAKRSAKEALAIADRCEYRLKQAEIHNFLAKEAMEAEDRRTAQKQAELAYERAWCDGPPHCYKPALEQAEKMLRELSAPLPKIA